MFVVAKSHKHALQRGGERRPKCLDLPPFSLPPTPHRANSVPTAAKTDNAARCKNMKMKYETLV